LSQEYVWHKAATVQPAFQVLNMFNV
jgi:hypothetical protein